MTTSKNVRPGSDATAAKKLVHSQPMAPRGARADETARRAPIERLRPGNDPTNAINRLYSEGRRFPHEQPAKWPARPAANTIAERPSQYDPGNFQHPQSPEDQHAANYDNQTSGWVRGAPNGQQPDGSNGDATRLPNFDHSPPRNKMRR